MYGFFLILIVFVVIYLISYFVNIKNGEVYYDICEFGERVQVIKKGIFMTTIAYTDKEPQKIFTLEFMLRYYVEN